MKVVIIEDEKLNAERLERLLIECNLGIEVQARLNSVKSALDWLVRHPLPEVIFLDIQLHDGTGFDVIEQLDHCPGVIFTTAYDQYAVKAFKYNSIDYLLKPIDIEELKPAIQKYLRHQHSQAENLKALDVLKSSLNLKYKKRFLVKLGQDFKSIPVEEISYFYNKEGMSYLCTAEQLKLPIDYSLDQVAEKLDPALYFRVNRNFLIHINSIAKMHTYFNGRLLLELTPKADEDVIVSREKVARFKAFMDG